MMVTEGQLARAVERLSDDTGWDETLLVRALTADDCKVCGGAGWWMSLPDGTRRVATDSDPFSATPCEACDGRGW